MKFIVRGIDGWWDGDNWNWNETWTITSIYVKDENNFNRKFYKVLKEEFGITFPRGKVRAVRDGDDYIIEERKTHCPLYIAEWQEEKI